MKLNTKKLLLQASGLLLTARNSLAANSVTSHMGPLSGMFGDILGYVFWAAVAIAILSMLAIWATGNGARAFNKITEAMDARKNKQAWIIDLIIMLFGFVILFGYAIPKLQEILGV